MQFVMFACVPRKKDRQIWRNTAASVIFSVATFKEKYSYCLTTIYNMVHFGIDDVLSTLWLWRQKTVFA